MSSRSLGDGSTVEYMRASAPLTAPPFTVLCWSYIEATIGAQQSLWGIFASSNNASFFRLVTGTAGDTLIQIASQNSASSTTPSTSAPLQTWNHSAAIFSSATSRSLIVNGDLVNKASNTVSRVPTPLNRFSIGARDSNAVLQACNGSLGEITMYNEALTDDECVMHYRGCPASLIRPLALVAWYPRMSRAPNNICRDEVGGFDLTSINGTSENDLAPIISRGQFKRSGG